MDVRLGVTGASLVVGGVLVMVAAFLPSLWLVWMARGVRAITLISENLDAWRLANWLFAGGAILTLAGMAALAGLLSMRRESTPWAAAGMTLFAVATALWLAALVFRLTVTTRIADGLSGGRTVPDWYEPVTAWAGALWYAAAMAGALSLVGFGLALLSSDQLPGWTGWVSVAFGAVMIVLFIVARDVPPFLLYVPTLAIGVTALGRSWG